GISSGVRRYGVDTVGGLFVLLDGKTFVYQKRPEPRGLSMVTGNRKLKSYHEDRGRAEVERRNLEFAGRGSKDAVAAPVVELLGQELPAKELRVSAVALEEVGVYALLDDFPVLQDD